MKKIIKVNLMFTLAMALAIIGGNLMAHENTILFGLLAVCSGISVLIFKWRYEDKPG